MLKWWLIQLPLLHIHKNLSTKSNASHVKFLISKTLQALDNDLQSLKYIHTKLNKFTNTLWQMEWHSTYYTLVHVRDFPLLMMQINLSKNIIVDLPIRWARFSVQDPMLKQVIENYKLGNK